MKVWLPMLEIFNVCTDVKTCNCTWRLMDTVGESALKVVSGRKISCRTRELNLPWRRASLTLYQLSYILSPNWATSPPCFNLLAESLCGVAARQRVPIFQYWTYQAVVQLQKVYHIQEGKGLSDDAHNLVDLGCCLWDMCFKTEFFVYKDFKSFLHVTFCGDTQWSFPSLVVPLMYLSDGCLVSVHYICLDERRIASSWATAAVCQGLLV